MIYEWTCDVCEYSATTSASVEERNIVKPSHKHPMTRQLGGVPLLYFEEGRARVDQGLGGKPITSPADRARRMRQQGVVEGNGVVPAKIAANPRSLAMKRYLEKSRGRWV